MGRSRRRTPVVLAALGALTALSAGCTDGRSAPTATSALAQRPAASAGAYGQLQYFGYVSSADPVMVDGTASYTNWGWFSTDADPVSTAVTARIGSHAQYGIRTIVDMGNLLWCGPGQRQLCPGWRQRLVDWRAANQSALGSGNVVAISVRDEPFNLHANIAQYDSAAQVVKGMFPSASILLVEAADSIASHSATSWWNQYSGLLTTVDWICADKYRIHPASDLAFQEAMARLKARFPGRRTVYSGDGWWSTAHAAAFGTQDSTYMATIIQEWYDVAAADPDAILLGVFNWDSFSEGKGSRDIGPPLLLRETSIGRAITGRTRTQSYAPLGAFQSLVGGVAWGWACDPDGAWGEGVRVDFYADGAWVGSTVADRPTTLAETPQCRTGTYHRFQAQLAGVGRSTVAVVHDLDAGTTTVQAPATVAASSLTPAGDGVLVVAGTTTNGSGTVQALWRDATANGPWTAAANQPLPAADGSWSTTVPNANYCHAYQAYASYAGATSNAVSYLADPVWCSEQARLTWIQPPSATVPGPAGSLVVQGTATGAPAGTAVQMYWRDVTAGQIRFTLQPATAAPDANGTWRNYITSANPLHQYAVYVVYDLVTSGTCLYGGTGHYSSCP
jgi:hypothetical protein